MAFKLGLNGVLARNTGTFGVPVWTTVPYVRDLNMPIESDEADSSNRGGGGFEMILPALHKLSVEFQMVYDPADADGWEAIRDKHIARTIEEYAIADGAIATSGTEYIRAFFYVTKSGRNEALREGMMVDVTLRPGFDSQGNPGWVETT